MRAEFVRWDCGCVGLRFPGESGTEVVLESCYGETPLGIDILAARSVEGKQWEPLTLVEVRALLGRLGKLEQAGHRYRELQMVLRVAVSQ